MGRWRVPGRGGSSYEAEICVFPQLIIRLLVDPLNASVRVLKHKYLLFRIIRVVDVKHCMESQVVMKESLRIA